MSEQRAGLAATNETLSQLCAETEKAQQLQISRIDSILERVTVQEAELPKLKNSTGDLSGELNAVTQRVDLLLKAVRTLYETEQQRQTALQQLTEVTGSLKATLPLFLEDL